MQSLTRPKFPNFRGAPTLDYPTRFLNLFLKFLLADSILILSCPDLWKFRKKHLQNSKILFAKQLGQIFKIL